ncbi:MAG: GNAT family N-acetyltransferase [Rhodospirillales bacterium]
MIRDCRLPDEFDAILAVINDGASAYRGVIPADRWKEPYMPADELRHEIAAGVAFSGFDEAGGLVGVMGVQPVQDVVLIRHAYVRTARRNAGIGSELLRHLLARTERPVLIGTWAAARWAIRFYEKHGFVVTDPPTKDRLLRRYWTVPPRQVETSVVLADARWVARHGAPAEDAGDGAASTAATDRPA